MPRITATANRPQCRLQKTCRVPMTVPSHSVSSSPPPQSAFATGLASPLCTGPCTAGYFCLNGSTTPNQQPCPAGQYSLAGSGNCTLCAAGLYGFDVAAPTANCSGPCAAGRYGTDGATSSACTATCSPGYLCGVGTSASSQSPCPAGRYSVGGAALCSQCAAGYYSNAIALPTPCSLAAPTGQYAVAGSAQPTPCPAGVYGNGTALGSNACTGPCPIGSYCPEGTAQPLPCHAGAYFWLCVLCDCLVCACAVCACLCGCVCLVGVLLMEVSSM